MGAGDGVDVGVIDGMQEPETKVTPRMIAKTDRRFT